MRRPTAALRVALSAGAVATAALTLATAGAAVPAVKVPRIKAVTSTSASPSDAHVARRAVSPRVSAALGPRGELRSVALNDVGLGQRALETTVADFPRMAQEGITSVVVYAYLYVATPSSNDVSTGLYTPQDTELQLVAAAAHASGLGFELMPVIVDQGQSDWRGRFMPSNINAFFASYTTQLLHYADLAKSVGASLLYVGSENRRLEPYTAQWRAVIAATRKHYSGALSYLAIPDTFTHVGFWDRLDLAAVSPYFSMGVDAFPTYERDLSAWRTVHNATIARLVRSTKTPIIFGEVGFNSQASSFSEPQASAATVGTPAPQAQADAYRALLDVLAGTKGVYGVSWWHWAPGTTIADMGYSPAGKPAECVLAAHWSQNDLVRQVASLPACDLHALDAALSLVPIPTVGRHS